MQVLPVRGVTVALLSILFPFLLVLGTVKLAFTESFVKLVYAIGDLPPDRWGMDDATRLRIALLGLRAVLSEEGMEEFIKSGLFNEREIKHMKDVQKVLSYLTKAFYGILPLWVVGVVSLRDKRRIGDVFLIGGFLGLLLVLLSILLSFLNYDALFEKFHNIVFDPYSWRFFDQDTLLRVYPMRFWFVSTLLAGILMLILSSVSLLVGLLLRKSR